MYIFFGLNKCFDKNILVVFLVFVFGCDAPGNS